MDSIFNDHSNTTEIVSSLVLQKQNDKDFRINLNNSAK